jgi:hypothetical protein
VGFEIGTAGTGTVAGAIKAEWLAEVVNIAEI